LISRASFASFCVVLFFFIFFFSSRRRHTRCYRDWSSDVCSSDLGASSGWNAPELAPWLRYTLDALSREVFSDPWRTVGVGGSIPFMAMLADTYPRAQFVVTGAAGRDSNAHVPDEWLNLHQAARVSQSVAMILD